MIKFLDGPAEGSNLSLGRVPEFLRVVIDEQGDVDALDQLEDKIMPDETAHVYYRVGDVGRVILCSRGRGCLTETTAEYRVYPKQPGQDTLRDNAAWQEWATKEYPVKWIETEL